MEKSVDLLRGARTGVEGNPRARAVMEVVEVSRTGNDWVLRGFDPDSIPLKRALDDPQVMAARTQAIAALEGTADPTLKNILRKLKSGSANLHWSPTSQKILVIDMQ